MKNVKIGEVLDQVFQGCALRCRDGVIRQIVEYGIWADEYGCSSRSCWSDETPEDHHTWAFVIICDDGSEQAYGFQENIELIEAEKSGN